MHYPIPITHSADAMLTQEIISFMTLIPGHFLL